MSQATDYFLGETPTERKRLVAQAEAFADEAGALLDQLGVRPGWRAIDVGCGPLGVVQLLADRVGPAGRVVGLEREATFAAMARLELAERGVTNAEVIEADIRDNAVPADSFDLAHERLVLIQSPEPDAVLASMIRMVRPGGLVVAEELDAASWLCHPRHHAWDRLMETFLYIVNQSGSNSEFGRELPARMRAAGLADVQVEARVRAIKPGEYHRTHLLALLESVRDAVFEQELLTEREWNGLHAELQAHLDDPNTLVLRQTLVQAWGVKPA